MSIAKLLRSETAQRWVSKLVRKNKWLFRFLNGTTLGRLVSAIKISRLVSDFRFALCLASVFLRWPRHQTQNVHARGSTRLRRWRTPLRGKLGLKPREKTDKLNVQWNLYFHVLRLPWPLFHMCTVGTYFITSMIFAFLYYLDLDGLHVETRTVWPGWVERLLPSSSGRSMLTVLLYSFSISTNFSQSTVDAHSMYTIGLGNVHALVMQLISVFWCSALCDRISQPVKVVRWSTVGVISGTGQSSAFARISSPAKYRVLTLRFDLLGAYTTGLIDAKFDVMCWNSSLNSQLMTRELSLIRKEASNICRGALLQHVIDESSPLYGCDIEDLKDEDYMFEVSVRAVEKTTMKQVFSEHYYSVHDGEILWDREFEDQVYADEDGNPVYDYTLLDSLKAIDARSRTSAESIDSNTESPIHQSCTSSSSSPFVTCCQSPPDSPRHNSESSFSSPFTQHRLHARGNGNHPSSSWGAQVAQM